MFTPSINPPQTLANVATAFCDCDCAITAGFTITGTKAAYYGLDQNGNANPPGSPIPSDFPGLPYETYLNDSFLYSNFLNGYVGMVAGYLTEFGTSSEDGHTTSSYYNQGIMAGAAGGIYLAACKYVVNVNWTAPWPADGSTIKVHWRVMTVQHSGTVTTTSNGTSPPSSTYSENCTVSFEAIDITLTPSPGDTSITSQEFELVAPSSPGYQNIVGPDDASLFTLNENAAGGLTFFINTTGVPTAFKVGFYPYTSQLGDVPATIYTVETATAAPHVTADYSGSQSYTFATDIDGTYHNNFSLAVPPVITSRPADNSPFDDGNYFFGTTSPTTGVTPTTTTFADGLILTLSTEDLTSRIVSRVNDAVAAQVATGEWGGIGGYQIDGNYVCLRLLPADESSYTAMAGTSCVYFFIHEINPIASFFGGAAGPAFVWYPTGSVTLAWDQVTVDLDTGAVGDPVPQTWTTAFDASGNIVTTSPTTHWSIPTSNQAIYLNNLSATGTMPGMDNGPQARFVAG